MDFMCSYFISFEKGKLCYIYRYLQRVDYSFEAPGAVKIDPVRVNVKIVLGFIICSAVTIHKILWLCLLNATHTRSNKQETASKKSSKINLIK